MKRESSLFLALVLSGASCGHTPGADSSRRPARAADAKPPATAMKDKVLRFDLTKRPSVSGLPKAERVKDQLFYEEDPVAEIKAPNGVVIREDLMFATVVLEGEDARYVVFSLPARTLSDACIDAREIAGLLGLPVAKLDAWQTSVQENRDSPFTFETMRNDLDPAISLAIERSFDRDRQWHLRLTFAW